jgi:hypothetical protein
MAIDDIIFADEPINETEIGIPGGTIKAYSFDDTDFLVKE